MDELVIWENGVANTNVCPEQKRALDLYIKYNTLAFIHEEVNKPLATVRDWIYTGRNGMRPFRDIRNELEREQLKELTKHKMPLMRSIMDNSLHAIKNSLESVKKGGMELTIDEVKKLSDIVSNMDKILKLDDGLATDNIAIARVNPINTAREIKEVIGNVDDFGIFEVDDES
jgi:hypothetical protein